MLWLAFVWLGRAPLSALTAAENSKSQSTLANIGFRRVGTRIQNGFERDAFILERNSVVFYDN